MPKKIDHDRIIEMTKASCSVSVISKRLRVSSKTVRRVLAERALEECKLDVIGSPYETSVWEFYKSIGYTPAEIAYMFGYSRQYITQYFNQPRQVSGSPE